MRRLLAAAPVLALAACNADPPPQPPGRSLAAPVAGRLPVMGREQPVLLLAGPLTAGEGLERDETYAARLETALRARGVNGRIVTISEDAPRAALSARIAASGERPALALIAAGAPPTGLAALAELGVPVHLLDPGEALRGKPDLLQSGGRYPNARGVEEMVAATAAGVAAALAGQGHPVPG